MIYTGEGSATILHGNALALDIADTSVDLVVTSPPYFGLRSYQDGGEHYEGQIGAEATPAEFVGALIEATREMVRVLKPSGSIWINLGDKYSTYEGPRTKPRPVGSLGAMQVAVSQENARYTKSAPTVYGIPYKSLMGIPWRYALRCIDELDLILRAEVIWSKPNGLPESVTDRVRRSHETWFHFTKQPRYYSAVDEIREPSVDPTRAATRGAESRTPKQSAARAEGIAAGTFAGTSGMGWSEAERTYNPLGKLPGSVWTIPTQPLTVPAHLGIDHFAAFPMEWPRRIIRGWSPAGVCVVCGEGRRPVAERLADGRPRATTAARDPSWVAINRADWQENVQRTITGYACVCPDTSAPTTPGVVLDPFSGTGTTALVAKVLGRHGIGVDLSADYCRLAEWRTNDPGQIASAMEVEKPPVEITGQIDLFDIEATA